MLCLQWPHLLCLTMPRYCVLAFTDEWTTYSVEVLRAQSLDAKCSQANLEFNLQGSLVEFLRSFRALVFVASPRSAWFEKLAHFSQPFFPSFYNVKTPLNLASAQRSDSRRTPKLTCTLLLLTSIVS